MQIIKSIISKIKALYKQDLIQEQELKDLLIHRFQNNYLNFRKFCNDHNLDLPESSLWDFFVAQNITINTQLIKNCYLIDTYSAVKIVTDSLMQARDEILKQETVELKICRLK